MNDFSKLFIYLVDGFPERKNLDLSPMEKAKIQLEAFQRQYGG